MRTICAAAVVLTGVLSGMSCVHVHIDPIYAKVDVNIKIDQELDSFFDTVAKQSTGGLKPDASTPSAAADSKSAPSSPASAPILPAAPETNIAVPAPPVPAAPTTTRPATVPFDPSISK